MSSSELATVGPVFRAVVETVAPRARSFDPEAWRRAEALVGRLVAARPAAVRRQLVLFLRVLDLLPLPRWGHRFRNLSPERRLVVLRRLERAPLLAVRRGVWGVRTLAWAAVYGQGPVQEAVGYRPSPAGWSARPDAVAAAPRGDGKGVGESPGPGPGEGP
jgi:hypothetical protein